MSQSDPNVASGTGTAVRTGLVNALLALLSMHSGTAFPAYKVYGTLCLRTDIGGSGKGTIHFYDGGSWVAILLVDTTAHALTWLAGLGTALADAYTTSAANVNAQTGTSYSLLAADNGKTVTMTNASASTLTVPSGLPAGFSCTVIQLGTGQVTIVQGSGATLRAANGLKLAKQYSLGGILYVAANTYAVGGDTST